MAVQKLFEVNLTPDDMGDPYIAMLGADGRQISSRDKIMRCTDTIVGYLDYSARTPPVNSVTETKLADCNSTATFIWGYAKISNQGAGYWSPMPDDSWFSVGGTYAQVYLWQLSTGTRWCEGFAGYSFYIEDGEVFVEERLHADRIYLNDYGQFGSYPNFRLNYHLWCCAFV